MTPAGFRRIALSMPDATESAHMGHPDFRVAGKIFATLGYPNERYGVVILSPEDQAQFVKEHPAAFSPVKGAWGKRGSTRVALGAAKPATLRAAVAVACRNKRAARSRK